MKAIPTTHVRSMLLFRAHLLAAFNGFAALRRNSLELPDIFLVSTLGCIFIT